MKKIMGFVVPSGTIDSMTIELDQFYPNDIEYMQGKVGGEFEYMTSAVHEATFWRDLASGHRPFNQFATVLARMNVDLRRDACLHGTVLITGSVDQAGLPTDVPEILLDAVFGMYSWRFQTQHIDGVWTESDQVFRSYLDALAGAIDVANGFDRVVPVRVVHA